MTAIYTVCRAAYHHRTSQQRLKRNSIFEDTRICSVIPRNRNNQSTESADGGGFLNFYKPLDYISSVLSFCSIFLDM